MSRIDEAWRRSSDDAAVGVAAKALCEPFSIDDYPIEAATQHTAASRTAIDQLRVPESGFERMPAVEHRTSRRPRRVFGEQSHDQYRRLALRLQEIQQARGIKTVAVTSVMPGDGKTEAVVRLAPILAEVYARRVLLIDADLHHPSMHERFGLPNESGLCDALRGPRRGLSVCDVSPLVSVLPCGRPDSEPLVTLASNRMRSLLEECSEHFDWVLLDTPPLSVPAEAPLLARRTHAAILVIAAATPLPVIERTMAALGRDRVVGTVLNGISE
jgi:Mrp family chromosome partitioning ATPase